MPTGPTLRYPYRARPLPLILGCLFFAGCAAVLVHVASTNERGIVLMRVIPLGPSAATMFLWGLAAASLAFIPVAILGLLRSFGQVREVVLDDRTLSVPPRLRGEDVVIPLRSVRGVDIREVGSQRFLHVEHDAGKTAVAASMLPSRDDFHFLIEELSRRVADARSAPVEAPRPPATPRPAAASGFGRRGL